MAKQLTNGSLAARLDKATKTRGKFNRERCLRFAKANGLDLNPALDNGRTAMVTRNAIRAKVKAGEKVTWPK